MSVGMVLKDRYRIVRELSRGGFGRVFLARDQQLHDRQVVIKIKLDQAIEDHWFERKFSEELRALTLIDHPGVVGALDSGRTPDGKPYLVMQYIEGSTLRGVMMPEGMPLDRAANLIRQIGQALGAAHDKRIWHRDLKPENIMLQILPGGDEHVKLIDFSIATIADLAKKDTRTRIAGSLPYMAPEQVSGQPCAATDVYAFGVIAYEMLTGRKPFTPEDPEQLASQQRAGVRLKPSTLRPELNRTAEKLILQSLNYNPNERPAHARVFGEDLSHALLAAQAARTTQLQPAPPAPRPKWILPLAAVPLVLVAIGAVWFYNSHRPPVVPAPKETTKETVAPSKIDSVSADQVELAYWNSISTSIDARLFREYLVRYPQGKFAGLAKLKLEPVTAKQATPHRMADTAALPPPKRPPLPAPRPALGADEYHGPLRGELRWSGSLGPGGTFTIQGGAVAPGTLSGELPRVPVSLEAATEGASVAEPPSASSQWDRVVVKNDSSKALTSVQLRWRIVR